jgi:hypothetical protein
MYEFIIKLSNILNELKNTIAGHGSRSDALYVRYKNKQYMVKLIELEPIEITDEMRKKHKNCDDETIEGFEQLKRMQWYE